ncbi:MlaD family protein [Haliscomenobacter hydrossis]|uniref:Mammalian cell entry related domain protein n=1 Tax=Haliscomenobacter hydrossis (strain ATCC 27775 / DSM 1100 / LMG 10767 / O) TaxID=760192 RepID=F4KW20_HALH1|nr:MlaD family protein [Haliscomenobacter hydrossis]AEE48218.1 Mammalian cell entry related domain protein [Haliscomenobacter hydrossis DSM 1100]
MSNEVKIALLALAAIALSFWGIKFIKGKNLLTRTNLYYVEYDDALSLQSSSAVVIQGVNVGYVADVKLQNGSEKVLVTLDLKKDLEVPKGTRAEIFANGFMGTKSVRLQFPPVEERRGMQEPGSYLIPGSVGFLGANIPQEELKQYMVIIQQGIKGAIDSLNKSLTDDNNPNSPVKKSLKNLELTLANLQSATAAADRMLASSSGDINGSLKNLNEITKSLATSKAKIGNIIDNADKFSGQLNEMDLKKTMTEVDQTIAGLKITLGKADQALGSVGGLVTDMQSGKGTLGRLLKSDSLYNEISKFSMQADSLTKDLKNRPYRYIPLKGRKRVLRYDKLDAKE